jgi:hypothetical protein
MVSHLLYTRVLEDAVPEERELGIEAGLTWAAVAEATVVYMDRGLSPGMKYGIKHAQNAGRPVEYRYIESKAGRVVESRYIDGLKP